MNTTKFPPNADCKLVEIIPLGDNSNIFLTYTVDQYFEVFLGYFKLEIIEMVKFSPMGKYWGENPDLKGDGS